MFIPSDIKKHLLIPMLSGKLDTPIFNFILHAEDGEHSFPAFLRRHSTDGDIELTIHNPAGHNLNKHFTNKTVLTPDDAIIGTGVLNGRFKVKLPQIYPPISSPAFYSSDVSHSQAIINIRTIEVPASGSDKSTYREISEKLAKLNNKPIPKSTKSEIPKYEHIAIFPEAELYYSNDQLTSKVNHPFWDGWTHNEGKLLNGHIWSGEFSIRQWNNHLILGYTDHSTDLDVSNSRWWALREAVAFALAFQPWPAYELTREDGRIVHHTICAKHHWQDSLSPLGKGYFKPNQQAPVDLIRNLGEWLASLPDSQRQTISEAIWIFRSADSPNTPFPAKQSMICGVVESLFNLFNPSKPSEEPPAAFTELKDELKKLTKDLNVQFPSPDHKKQLDNLRNLIGNWKPNYISRKQQWLNTFAHLFPNESHVKNSIFQAY